MDAEARIDAAREIANLGETQAAIKYLSTVVEDESADDDHRMVAARQIAEIGNLRDGYQALNSLAQEEISDADEVLIEHLTEGAAKALTLDNAEAVMDGINTIFDLLGESGIDLEYLDLDEGHYRLRVARRVAALGDFTAAIGALEVITNNESERFDESDRQGNRILI